MSAPDADEVVVVGERPVDTATSRALDRAAVESFPAASADELLRAIPGLHLSAHGGTGKAFQFLIRGFDAEHGSDLLVTVEGVPINEPSNVHGQGYIDLHFLPTALVEGLELVKGSYRAEDGDFAITGSANYDVGLAEPGLGIATFVGTDGAGGGSLAWRPAGATSATFVVAEGEGGEGVGEGRRYAQVRAAAGLAGPVAALDARAMIFAYDGAFESPGVLRIDDLESGELGFYDAYDEAGGGASRRVLAIAALDRQGERGGGGVTAWGGLRRLSLEQNYTGYYDDPIHGDGTRQSEEAGDVGLRAEGHRLGAVRGQPWAWKVGIDARYAAVSVLEVGVTPDGRAWAPLVDAELGHLDAGLWTEGRLVLADRLTLVPGLRADYLALRLGSARSAALPFAPKATVALRVVDPLTIFAAAGRGFRSPHALGIADADLAPVTTTASAEAGLRAEPADALALSATAFSIGVSDELVFDHFAGRFLSAGRTRRLGVESVVDWRPIDWLRLQADATWTDARFTTTDEPIPYAPRWLGAIGAFLESAPVARGARLSGGLRAFHIGPRPLPSGFASRPAAVVALASGLDVGGLGVGVDVENLLGSRYRDGEFVFPSWFDPTTPRSELKLLHVTAGDPLVARFSLGGQW